MYTILLPVETALKLREKVDVKNIDSITIFLDSFCILSSAGPEKYDPHTRETADHSIPYLVAAALLDGGISEKTYTHERIRDPELLDVLKRSSMKEDPRFTQEWPKTFNCRIEITEKSGKKSVEHLKNPKGHPANPMSDAEIEEKFLKLTHGLFTSKESRAVLDLLWHFEEVEDVGKIVEAIVI
jgi:2-methylcitrate dehydratase